MIEGLFTLGIRFQAAVATLVVLLTVFLGIGMTRLEIDTSFNSLIPGDEPERLVYQRVMDEFGSDNKTIIYIRDKHLWTPEKLERLDQIVRDLKETDHVTRVDSLFSLRTIQGETNPIKPILAIQCGVVNDIVIECAFIQFLFVLFNDSLFSLM